MTGDGACLTIDGMRLAHHQDRVMHDQTVVMAVASYASKGTAKRDWEAVCHVGGGRKLAHVAAALLEKGADGELVIDMHDNTADGLSWGDALLGGPLIVIATPVGIRLLVSTVKNARDWAGIGAIARHFWNDIPRQQLRQMSDLLEIGQASVVVVAVGCDRQVLGARLDGATNKVLGDSIWADFETEFALAIEEARVVG